MKNAWLIASREIGAYLRSPLGYIVAAAVLLIDGLLFQTRVMAGSRLSSDVLFEFFYNASGLAMIASVLLTMRLLAHERERGTLVLMNTAPIRDAEIVLGKFLAAFLLLTGITALTAYMPALIFVNGRVSLGHILVGYLGVVLLGSATTAVGVFASALARTQIVAAVIGGATVGTLILLWLVAKVTDPPLSAFLSSLALHHERQAAFMKGVLRLENVFFYLGMTYFFLLAATKVLEARRWR